MVRMLQRRREDGRETLLVALPLLLAVLACGAVAWLTLLSGHGAVAAKELSDAPDSLDTEADAETEGTAPRRATDARVFIAGETQ